MTGVEINLIVPDSLKALELYESIFELERIEVTAFPRGRNEAVFTIYGARFHMLDENPNFQLLAPKPGAYIPIWFNVLVPDIQETFTKAQKIGCTEIQSVKYMPDFGASNAIFCDPFGYQWLLHQVHKPVSFEERTRILEDKNK